MTNNPERDDDSFESVITTEIEFLEAVYINELVLERNEHGRPVRVSLQLHPATGEDTDQQYVCLNLAFLLPADYPHILPEIHIKNPRGLSESHVQSIRDTLHGMAKEREGSSMLYDLIEYTKESLNEVNIPHGQCVICLEQFCESDIFQKTECYHYFHSYCLLRYVRHCLKVIEEEQMQALRHKCIAEKQVVCPVCREPLTYDLEALEKHPEPTGEKDLFQPDSDLRERQRKMAEMFEKQRLKGGIIDVEAERNKFYITLGQKTEFTETETSEGVADIVPTSEISELKVEGEQQLASKEEDDSRYRGKGFQFGKGRGHEKHRRRGMGRGYRRHYEHHSGKSRIHPENNYAPSDQSRKQFKDRFRLRNDEDRLLNGEDKYVERKPGDRRQLQRMDECEFKTKTPGDRRCLVDDKLKKCENIEKKTNRENEGSRNSIRVDVKKDNSVEDTRRSGHAQRGGEISHFDCDVKTEDLLKTEKSDQILDDKPDEKSNVFDGSSESSKPSDKGFSGYHKPVPSDHSRPRKSYRKPPRKDKNLRENGQNKPCSSWQAYSSEDRHSQSNSEAMRPGRERKCLLNGEAEEAVAGVSHIDKDKRESDCRIVKTPRTREKKNSRFETYNRSRIPGTDYYQTGIWETAEDVVDDYGSKKERQGFADVRKTEDVSRGRVKNNSSRYSEKSKTQRHAVKKDFRKNDRYHQDEKKYTFPAQKSREVEKTSNNMQKSSERQRRLSQDESLEDWSVDCYTDPNEKKLTLDHKLSENQGKDQREFNLDRTNKGNGFICNNKDISTNEDNCGESKSVISSSDRRADAYVERKSKHLKDTIKQKQFPCKNFEKYTEHNCDYNFEVENCLDRSVDSFKKGDLNSSEMSGQGDEMVSVSNCNAVANNVSRKNLGRIPPGFHTIGPPPGFQTLGNMEASGLDVFS